jgi:hypothetical protein
LRAVSDPSVPTTIELNIAPPPSVRCRRAGARS